MSRIFYATFLALILAACSSTKPEPSDGPRLSNVAGDGGVLTTGFTGSGVKVAYRKDGQWERITSTASAKFTSSLGSAADEATVVATMKARRQIAEFLNLKVTSKKTLEEVSETLESNNTESSLDPEKDQAAKVKAAKVTQRLIDSLQQNSTAILNGTVVESEFVDAEARQVTVTVFVDRKTQTAAKDNL